ncbi:MAG: transposase, partial [Chloroflexota bacterium]
DMLRKATADGNVDVLREGVRVLAEAIMEAEVSELTGAAKGERAPDRRLTNRNGYRERRWDTRVGTIGLAILECIQSMHSACFLSMSWTVSDLGLQRAPPWPAGTAQVSRDRAFLSRRPGGSGTDVS